MFKNLSKKSSKNIEKFEENNNYNEPEIIETFTDEELVEYKHKNKIYKISKKIINISFIVIITALLFISIDVISVTRYNKGPFFAIKTKTYKDGGSKVYYGIGYKVIKYHQVQGRRDMELGFWSLKYNTNPIDISDVDLAIEFENDYEATSKKYYKKFVRLNSTVKKIDKKNNKLTLQFLDESNKYTLDIICYKANSDNNKKDLKEGSKINIIGTIDKFKVKTKTENNKVYISNCFI